MDMLFSKYACPFLFINTLIAGSRFSEFIDEFLKINDEEKTWSFYLHKVFDKSYLDFKESLKPQSKENLETTVKNSFEMLNNFKIEGG